MSEPSKIIVIRENQPAREIELGERLSIGRAPDNALVLDDNNASRHHAEMRRGEHGRYQLIDLGSANGTWHNGRRLARAKRLSDGDRIKIGKTTFLFSSDRTSSTIRRAFQRNEATPTMLSLQQMTVVVLVADIRDYSRMSRELPCTEFSQIVTDWFQECTTIIERHSGTIDKFIGDAVMAYWEVEDSSEPSAEINRALQSATEMLDASQAFSARLSSRFKGESFRIGIGLNFGNAILGNVGSSDNPSFTAVGDDVNIAFRLENLTRRSERAIIVSDAVVRHADRRFQFHELGPVKIKGQAVPLSVYALIID